MQYLTMASSAGSEGPTSDHGIATEKIDEANEISACRAEITRLQAETISLKGQVQKLSKTLNWHSSGMIFARFNDLPVEIRCMIW